MTDPCEPILPPVVTFSFTEFAAMFPVFANVDQAFAKGCFTLGGLYFANNALNPALCSGSDVMKMLAYLVTAHLAWLNAPRDAQGNPAAAGQAPSPLTGRITSASEGSVSVAVELKDSGSPSEAFFSQTPYGLQFWQATAQYRQMRYIANPTYVPTAIFPMRPCGRRGW